MDGNDKLKICQQCLKYKLRCKESGHTSGHGITKRFVLNTLDNLTFPEVR